MNNSKKQSIAKLETKHLSDYWTKLSDNKFCLTESGKASIKRFLQELPANEIQENMDISFERIPDNNKIEERFKYFCGICWNKIRGINYNIEVNKEIL